MPTIKHVGTHVDDMHDGRPMVPYRTYDLTHDELQLDHYQSRLVDGSLLEVTETADEPAGETGTTDEVTTDLVEDDLDPLKVSELRDRAADAGLDLPKTATKPALIQALRQHAANQETDHDAA